MLLVSLACVAVAIFLSWLGFLPLWAKFAFFGLAAVFALLSFMDNFIARVSKSDFARRNKILLIFLPLFFVVNFSARYFDHVFDFSRGRFYSFRPSSIEWLKQVDRDVVVTVFSKSDGMSANARWVKEQLEKANPRIQLQVKNLNKEPVLARKYGVQKAGEVVLQAGDVWDREDSFEERILVPAVAYLVFKSDKQLCFSVGNGESDLADSSAFGLSELQVFIQKLGYHAFVADVRSMSKEELEKQCGALVVMGAGKPLFPSDEEKLHQLFFQSELPMFLALGEDISATWKRILSDAGVKFSHDVMFDPRNEEGKIPVTDQLVNSFTSHPLVQDLTQYLYFSNAHSLALQPTNNITWDLLLRSNDAELVDVETNQKVNNFVTFAVASSGGESGRKVIFASKRTFMNRYLDFGSAQPLFLNSIRWLLNEQKVTWMPNKDQDEKYLQFSPEYKSYVKWTSFLVLPLLVFLGCFSLWLGRIKEK